MTRPTRMLALTTALTLFALTPGLAAAQAGCSHESRCPEGQTWDEASGSCTVPMSS